MNKFKAHLVTATCVVSAFLFLPASLASAAGTSVNNPSNLTSYSLPSGIYSEKALDHWVSMPIKENVSKDKIWNISLKNPISKTIVNNSSIFVLDDYNNKVETSLTLSDDCKQIKVAPIANYSPNHGYLLCIVDANSGTCMPFTINSDSIKVDQSFNNKSITLKKGETLQLTLPETVSGIDGGYSWKLQNFDETIIENTDSMSITTLFYPKKIPGISLNDRWLFKSLTTGTTSLNLEYQRPWEGSASDINTFKLNINVQ